MFFHLRLHCNIHDLSVLDVYSAVHYIPLNQRLSGQVNENYTIDSLHQSMLRGAEVYQQRTKYAKSFCFCIDVI